MSKIKTGDRVRFVKTEENKHVLGVYPKMEQMAGTVQETHEDHGYCYVRFDEPQVAYRSDGSEIPPPSTGCFLDFTDLSRLDRTVTLELTDVEANVLLAAINAFTVAVEWDETVDFFGSEERANAAYTAFEKVALL